VGLDRSSGLMITSMSRRQFRGRWTIYKRAAVDDIRRQGNNSTGNVIMAATAGHLSH
jgi:hypothetical protein